MYVRFEYELRLLLLLKGQCNILWEILISAVSKFILKFNLQQIELKIRFYVVYSNENSL